MGNGNPFWQLLSDVILSVKNAVFCYEKQAAEIFRSLARNHGKVDDFSPSYGILGDYLTCVFYPQL
ncbi:hypothetical protein [Candidatus Steffania adelgidicola]|uniref:hypothetical protein n=1 Tax=Candidatus Steffania adelgidicola TaxID=1076626 RepID=UPI001D02B949|nr:hypothetical protein [Candidatus Steffania adelgidicola]